MLEEMRMTHRERVKAAVEMLPQSFVVRGQAMLLFNGPFGPWLFKDKTPEEMRDVALRLK